MIIGFDAKRLFRNTTGLGNYSRFVVEALCSAYPDNRYLLFSPKEAAHAEALGMLKRGNVTPVEPPALLRLSPLNALWRSFLSGSEAERRGVQLYHGLSHEIPADLPGSVASVVTVHDLIPERYPQFYPLIDRTLYSWKLRSACRRADKVVAISRQTASDLVEFLRVPEEKISVVYQGCHAQFHVKVEADVRTEVRHRLNLPATYLLSVGTLEPRKNALILLKALRVLGHACDLPLVLVGRETPYSREIRHYAREHGLESRLHIVPDVRFADLPAVYQMASVFVYPSLFEGFGIPVLEAIVSGVPVVTSSVSSLPEAGGPYSRYADPANEEEIAFRISELLESDDERSAQIAKSLEYAGQFRAEAIAHRMMKVYREIAS
jgi:glycosyltransferase involved in cell wall biosynthesis